MKAISYMGMVFLPGTFLAVSTHPIHDNPCRRPHLVLTLELKKTLFSMTFFNWIPDESPQVISPWIALYCGSAAILTLLTWWFSRRYITESDKVARIRFQEQLQTDDDSFV